MKRLFQKIPSEFRKYDATILPPKICLVYIRQKTVEIKGNADYKPTKPTAIAFVTALELFYADAINRFWDAKDT